MLLSAALISLAVMVPASEPQSAPPDSGAPYSLDGVRRAAARPARPTSEPGPVELRISKYRLAVDTWQVTYSPCSQLVIVCQPVWRGGAHPTWNDEYLAMTQRGYGFPYSGAPGNRDRALAVGSSVGFALAFQGVASLVHKAAVNRRENKVKKIRAEIAAELEALERANQAPRQAEPDVKKPPRSDPQAPQRHEPWGATPIS
jgi:hypothetical protein